MQDARFTVDTHLFRELGELLVGRESTAVVELIKNSYDADATEVTVYGEGLKSPETGRIVVTDNGTGMSRDQFVRGFLRIASRLKEEGKRRSALHRRRYTGAKGVGRIAAQKLARLMRIESYPNPDVHGEGSSSIQASIDWDIIDSTETLEDVQRTDAIRLGKPKGRSRGTSGTVIELVRLRKAWTPAERARFFWEVETFRPPRVLVEVPSTAVTHPLLFKEPRIADADKIDPGLSIALGGEFESGEDYWDAVVESADWIIEIDAMGSRQVRYAITPTVSTNTKHADAEQLKTSVAHPDPKRGPFFQARILVREGVDPAEQRPWLGKASGIRVYMEGFRVLPYGEQSDDWLEIDADYTKRRRVLRYLEGIDGMKGSGATDEDEALTFRRKDRYFGAAFLTQEKASSLRMVVNREGFVPDAAFDILKRIIRIGIDLSVRHAAAARAPARAKRREERREERTRPGAPPPRIPSERLSLREEAETTLRHASEYADEAKKKAAAGKFPEAGELVRRAAEKIAASTGAHERLMTERSSMQILAAVGLQMASFVHEINGLLGTVSAIEDSVKTMRLKRGLDPATKRGLTDLSLSIGELRRIVERQASYLLDITSPDARRRRSRQSLAERFDAGARIVKPAAERRGITIENKIPSEINSPPMFPAEMALVFSNLLTNAIKAAGDDGRIRATAARGRDGETKLRVENTGMKVRLAEAERWFRPFESTTTELDPILGQGMGMGLPITRNILEEYGAEIHFVEPRDGFVTAVEITFH
jgi:signal transduction histidine kinase